MAQEPALKQGCKNICKDVCKNGCKDIPRDIRKDIGYTEIANSYDVLHGQEQERKSRLILSYLLCLKMAPVLQRARDAKILDIGCGTGIFLELAGEEFPKCKMYGIEPDKGMLTVLNKKLGNIKLGDINNATPDVLVNKKVIVKGKARKKATIKKAFAERIPFKNNLFDAIVCITAAHNFTAPKKAFSEMKRVGKNNAILAISLLKKSAKFELLSKQVSACFKIEKIINDEKDTVFLGRIVKRSSKKC